MVLTAGASASTAGLKTPLLTDKQKRATGPTWCCAVYLAISAVHSFAMPRHWLWGDEASTQTLAQSTQAADIRRLP